MPRPRRCRWVGSEPNSRYFKPRGIPLTQLEETVLTVDEMEAIRLADLEGLYQEVAAKRMNVSRQTFGRIISSARRKMADAIIHAKAIKIEGGNYVMAQRTFRCSDCEHTWKMPHGTDRPSACPTCDSVNIHRPEKEREHARRGGPGRESCGS
ncbi:MAG: DUF134 domain-containing protein [Gemmatimonadota bacterium]|nr:MAG: DUF134 domain-containing protein [Gemmatimonadota bacterium]